LASKLKEAFKERVLGPEFPIVKRIYNLFLKKITLKIERNANDKMVKDHIHEIMDDFFSDPSNKSIRSVIDVDPN
jgi:primosomal protein N' (replication factor Y)